jgi:chromosomal replication initiation ATPase DnaA
MICENELIKKCAEKFGTTTERMISNEKLDETCFARHAYCYIRQTQCVPYSVIARELNRKSKSSVHWSIETAKDLIQYNRWFSRSIDEILKME